jgi:Rrf2 family protein
MNVSKKHQYGLSAMVQLGFLFQKGPVQLRLISENAKIPHAFLEQLILNLKKSGLVKSTRGAKGGYQLTTSPDQVVVDDIFSAIDPLLVETANDNLLTFFWTDFDAHIREYLSLSLKNVMDNVKKKDQVLTYTI